ncbi:benzaldehyde lyase (plasmid) [Rhodococcus erythropolis]|uniref:thiamine pyrophosphate-binding protein n=1 Tax=Rhodococcus erythropolis TaxID=1833 RepID=UPI00061B7B8A|nr:thiamine pyrophosphate-binding protein [Rhodococcus erythropolis]AKE01089.1 benzaldehyde lyase [Rhodococcus erythropolis]
MQENKEVDGGELVARTLRRAGVEKVFALHGGHLESFYRGCLHNGLELVDFRHEASAGHAAEAYARVTGEIGVCAITAGPGFANAIPAILNAYVDASPMVFLIGAPPLRERETNELQGGFDQLSIAKPTAKWVVSVSNVERIPALLAEAVRRASTGRRGPVVVELPIDVLHMITREDRVLEPTGLLVRPRPAPSTRALEELRTLLLESERPAIIVGGDARFAKCEGVLAKFAERSGIPVFASKRGLGLLPTNHPNDAHDAANLAMLTAKDLPRPDLVILAGTRMGLFLGGRGYSVLPQDAKLVQIYSDPGEIGRIRDVDLAITADVGSLLDDLDAATATTQWPDWSAWRDLAVDQQNTRAAAYPDTELVGGIHPFHAMAELAEVAGPEAIWAIDGGEAGQWAVQHAKTSAPGTVITTGYLGGLGVGPGYAIGAQVAVPDRRVVLVSGDGSIGFHLQEFDIMVHNGYPIVTVILNNEIWGMSLHGQEIMYGKGYNAISTLGGRNYAEIARAFGCHAERVASFAELRPALERAFESGKPACVEVMTDPGVVSPGLVQMLGDVDPEIPQIVVPYYENIPI